MSKRYSGTFIVLRHRKEGFGEEEKFQHHLKEGKGAFGWSIKSKTEGRRESAKFTSQVETSYFAYGDMIKVKQYRKQFLWI